MYLWNAGTGDISQLMETSGEGDFVTSVSWAADGKHIAVGTNAAEVQIWDAARSRQVRSLRGHAGRVSASSWSGHTLATGGRDSAILLHDVRVREHVQARLVAHEQEVCGLKWSPSGQQLASGGNDNLLCIWDAAVSNRDAQAPALRLEAHQAAVKALAWCPFQSNLLASGGGSADRCIKASTVHALDYATTATVAGLAAPTSAALARLIPQHPAPPAVLEHAHGRLRQLHRHGVSGLRAAVEPPRARDPLEPRLRPEPAVPVEVPLDGQDGGAHGPLGARAAHGPVARRHGRRQRRR